MYFGVAKADASGGGRRSARRGPAAVARRAAGTRHQSGLEPRAVANHGDSNAVGARPGLDRRYVSGCTSRRRCVRIEGRAGLGIPNAAPPLDRRGPNHQLPKKIRVYELARELGLTNKEALDLCIDLGIGVKSHSSSIEDAQADRARRKADREGLRRAVQPEEPAAAPSPAGTRRRSGAAAGPTGSRARRLR